MEGHYLGYQRKFVIDSLDKIQYIEYQYKGQIIQTKPTRLTDHTRQMLAALGGEEKVAIKK